MNNIKPQLVLFYTDNSLLSKANILSEFTNCFKLVEVEPKSLTFYLRLDNNGLAIISSTFKPLYISEIYANLVSRYKNLKTELLVQLVKDKCIAKIWDLTAGLGKDAFMMASAGYEVTMVEQNPMLATILYYALNNNILPKRNLHLVYANSIDFLGTSTDTPDIIYLDPMFKESATSKAKKEMQLIQMLTNNDNVSDDVELFNTALAIASRRVIIKRDNKQATLVNAPLPSYTKTGKTIRFDVYNT